MIDAFLEAWVNTDHVIFGKKLHPFCLEDVVNLYAVESPVVQVFEENDEEKVGLARIPKVHLELFAYICSTRPPIDFSKTNPVWRLANMFRDPDNEALKLAGYLKDYLALPDTIPVGDISNSFEPGAPWPLQMATNLARHAKVPYFCNYCSDDSKECVCIWRMPLGKAFWLSAAVMESTGQTRIADEEFEDFYADIQREKRRREREQQGLNDE